MCPYTGTRLLCRGGLLMSNNFFNLHKKDKQNFTWKTSNRGEHIVRACMNCWSLWTCGHNTQVWLYLLLPAAMNTLVYWRTRLHKDYRILYLPAFTNILHKISHFWSLNTSVLLNICIRPMNILLYCWAILAQPCPVLFLHSVTCYLWQHSFYW